jgi:hypothetical protein
MDLFVVPTIGFKLLYAFVILRLDRRNLVWINITAHPTAEWVARQITEAFPWDEAPRYMIRDRDCRVRFRSAAGLPLFLFLADCIINIAGSKFSAGTRMATALKSFRKRSQRAR